MSILSSLRYFVECNACGRIQGDADSAAEAAQDADGHGWVRTHIDQWLCRRCAHPSPSNPRPPSPSNPHAAHQSWGVGK